MKTLLLILGLTITALTGRGVAVEFSTVESDGQRFTVCRVNVSKEKLELFHRDGKGEPFKKFDRLAPWVEARGRKLVFAMNAGMFHSDFTAVGLLVIDGKQVSPLNTADGKGNFFLKPNGVFVLTGTGAHVVESSQYPQIRSQALLATQSGPLLVQGGKLHPAFNASGPSRLLRNGVGVPSPDTALFVISDTGVNFHTFATLFRDKLHCPDALFLDGNISSLYAPALKRADSRPELGPIIGVTE